MKRQTDAMEKVVSDIYASQVALERITVAMLKLITPTQLDAIKEIVFTQNGYAEDTIGTAQESRTLREKRIQQRAADLLSLATPHK